jgi:hypothetical protein
MNTQQQFIFNPDFNAQVLEFDRRRPENDHLRKLWDAKDRMANSGEWEAYKRLEAVIRLYRKMPEVKIN